MKRSANSTVITVSNTEHVNAACARIAPTWPLDQFIAVNPYWGWRTSPAPVAAATLGALGGTALTMPRSYFRGEWAAARLTKDDIEMAAAFMGERSLVDAAMTVLAEATEDSQLPIPRMALVTDVCDRESAPRPGQTWAEVVTHQISQHCAAHFDRWQGSWHPGREVDLFAGWRLQLSASHGVKWRHGASWVREQISCLPEQPDAAITMMLSAMSMPKTGQEAYLTALLLSVNGWAAWCAYERWQARLAGGDDDEIVGLLAIRLAWEWLLQIDGRSKSDEAMWNEWRQSWTGVNELANAISHEQRVDWLLQTATEMGYQSTLISALNKTTDPILEDVPSVQLVFCIDVRSEVIRRALETAAREIQTRGFAGFFGLPIAYSPVGSALKRPQLPGLMAPVFNVTETVAGGADLTGLRNERSAALGNRQRWNSFRSAPSSVFTFVESQGLLYGAKLVKDSLGHAHGPSKWEHDGLTKSSRQGLRPRLGLIDDDPKAAAELAHRVLRGMGLTTGLSPLVVLCGHGGQTMNNPHAAGLDCGACGGQTGEVNARVLADLLNSETVRTHLTELGIVVPFETRFIAGLHNTTTDEIELFDTESLPESHQSDLVRLRERLGAAGQLARSERADSLGLGDISKQPERLKRAVLQRANDWSQVRPEWGLAGNAAFIVAPRQRTRQMDLGGRSFLHDYDWRLDTDLAVLTLIMTAPMVVTNWINMQYHASTVDNRRYGSGNKMLHNVVGGRIGVFEGNGGDLRIGLSIQSLHDGHTLRHPPLRLSVFIEAPREGIDSIIGAHTVVHELVSNAWLNLLRIDPSTGQTERWTSSGWITA